jgi:hypothetical protein
MAQPCAFDVETIASILSTLLLRISNDSKNSSRTNNPGAFHDIPLLPNLKKWLELFIETKRNLA